MNYYAAPMEGLTDRIWRQAHQRWFGAPEAPVRYYAPFLSPPENRVLIKRRWLSWNRRPTRGCRSSRSCWQRTANLRPG